MDRPRRPVAPLSAYIYRINDVLFERAGGELADDEIRELARRWILADRLRFVVGVVGFLAALQAFRLPLGDPPAGSAVHRVPR